MDVGCQYRPSPMPLWKSSVTRPLCHTNEVLMRDEPRRLLHRVMMWKLFKKTKKKPLNFRNMRDRGSRKWAAWKRHVTTSLCLPVWVLRKNLTELLLKCPKETQIDGYFLSFFFFCFLFLRVRTRTIAILVVFLISCPDTNTGWTLCKLLMLTSFIRFRFRGYTTVPVRKV